MGENLGSTIVQIPNANGVVPWGRDEEFAVGRELEGRNSFLVSFKSVSYIFFGYFPDLDEVCLWRWVKGKQVLHTRMRESFEPVARHFPSGLKHKDLIHGSFVRRSVRTLHHQLNEIHMKKCCDHLPNNWPCLHIVNPRLPVIASSNQISSIWTEFHTPYRQIVGQGVGLLNLEDFVGLNTPYW